MIPNHKDREMVSGGIASSHEFGISLQDSAHVMNILRDTLYSDKILAVLREYSANAWDSHRVSGKAGVPIKVVLPTGEDPTLSIQDFGAGLSHQDVFEVFTQYGASTKRNDDNSVGMLGIGSKSGFAYSDSFTIISRHGGMCRTYVAVLDETEKGMINLLNEASCGDETGVTIQIAVRPEDIWEFTTKAKSLFQYFIPRPDINTELPEIADSTALEHGLLRTSSAGGWIAVMGCVPYRVNMDQLKNKDGSDNLLGDYISNLSGVLFFNIGEVQVSASREELKYSNGTKTAIINKLHSLVEEFVKKTLENIENANLSMWEKRLKCQVLSALKLSVDDDYKDLLNDRVRFDGVVPTHFIFDYSAGSKSIKVQNETRLLYQDTDKKLVGYNLGQFDYIISLVITSTWDDAKKELKEEYIDKLGLDGIPIKSLSELTWVAPASKNRRRSTDYFNIKHHKKVFRLDPAIPQRDPYSACWDPETREPTADDVFVLLNCFRAQSANFYSEVTQDRKIATTLGVKMPEIYGYKTTVKKPVLVTDCLGTHYPEWRKGFLKSLLTDHTRKLLTTWLWGETLNSQQEAYYSRYSNFNRAAIKAAKAREHLSNKLGKQHLLVIMTERLVEIKGICDDHRLTDALRNLYDYLELHKDPTINGDDIKLLIKKIYQKYSLFSVTDGGIYNLWGSGLNNWVQYIKLVDTNRKRNKWISRRTLSQKTPSLLFGKGKLIQSRPELQTSTI